MSHYAKSEDLYGEIVAALAAVGKSPDALTAEDLAPVDHFHARGLPATVELADRLPIAAGSHILDIGSGLGGPARYMAKRFGCCVTGIDITPEFVECAQRLTMLVHIETQVAFDLGDGARLPYGDAQFDGAYSQHVMMNVPDRQAFFSEAHRVLKPGAFFALTEQGLGAKGDPHYPLPWSEDGRGSHLATPAQTRGFLAAAGFTDIVMQDTGPRYAAAYRKAIEIADKKGLPPLGLHLVMGGNMLEKLANAARNIEEGRTHPVAVFCRKRA